MVANSMIGQTILGYTVEEELGSGSFGKVYKVSKTNPSGKYTRALKHIILPSEKQYYSVLSTMGGDTTKADEYFSEALGDLVSEIKILNELTDINAPNIVRYYENDIVESYNPKRYDVFILMEYLTPLDKYVINNEVSVEDVTNLGMDILEGLKSCHNNNIIHRDIKIENIFVTSNKHFKIGDFGVSKILLEQSRAQSVIGTPNFLAPEVYAGAESYSTSVDLYSLGIVLYRLLNYNRNPFLPPYPEQYYAADEQAAFERRMRGETPNLPAFGGEKIGEVIVRAISSADKRYKTAEEFQEALKQAVEETSSETLDSHISLNELNASILNRYVTPNNTDETVIDNFTATEATQYPGTSQNTNPNQGFNTYPNRSIPPQVIGNNRPRMEYSKTYNESAITPMTNTNPNMSQSSGVNRYFFESVNEGTASNYPNRRRPNPPPRRRQPAQQTSALPVVLITILAVIVVLAIAVLGYYFFKPSETVPDSNGGIDISDEDGNGITEVDENGVPIDIDYSSSGDYSNSGNYTNSSSASYVIPDSDTRYLTESDLSNLSETELCIARNEIPARHGRRFDTDWIQEYFNSESWYTPKYSPQEFDSMQSSLMSDVEISNMNTIKSYEEKMGY